LDSENPDLRYLALGNLIEDKLTEGEQVSKRVPTLLYDPSPKVRAIAVFSARSLDLATVETTLRKLAGDESAEVRLEAIEALGPQCGKSAQVAQTLLSHLNDPSILVRLQVIDELRECTKSTFRSEIVQRLLTELSKRSQPERLMMLKTLGTLGESGEVEQTLLGLLASDETPTVTVAAEALGRLKSPSAVHPLFEAIQQERGHAEVLIEALESIGTPEASQALLRLLDTDNGTLRIAVIEALGKTEGNIGLSELGERLIQQEARMGEEVDSVKWVDFGKNYPEFTALLEAIDDKGFGGLDEFIEPPISQLLTSETAYEKLISLKILAEGEPYDRMVVPLGQERQDIVPHLERLSADSSPLMRAFALQALGNVTDKRSAAVLETAAQGGLFGTRYAAIQAISRYVANAGDYSLLARLYEVGKTVIPKTYTSEDQGFLIRKAIDASVMEAERDDVTRHRREIELATSSPPSTRLLAALWLAEEKNNMGLPVLLEFLERGTIAEKQVALDGLDKLSFASVETISRLQEVRAKEQDPELAEKLGQLIEKLQTK
jgi:HEAT repeat protein